jgi:hypothetical protein
MSLRRSQLLLKICGYQGPGVRNVLMKSPFLDLLLSWQTYRHDCDIVKSTDASKHPCAHYYSTEENHEWLPGAEQYLLSYTAD